MNYEFLKQSLQKDEWVQVCDEKGMLNGFVGYIAEHDFWNSRYRVRLTTSPNGKRSNGLIWIPEHHLVSIDNSRHEEDLTALIEFSLAMKDEDWFLELTHQLLLNNF